MSRQSSHVEIDGERLVRCGTDKQTVLAHEFGLLEWPWPKILGESRAKWEATAEFVTKAALKHHEDRCGAFMGRDYDESRPPPFKGDHADGDRRVAQRWLVSFIAAGIPRFLTEDEAILAVENEALDG